MKRYPFETDEHVMFREALQKFLAKEAVPYYEEWEENRLIPISFWKKLGEMGFLCSQVAEKYGGLGLDFSYGLIVGEELERVGAGLTGVGLHNDIVVPYIEAYGTEAQKEKWLPGCVSANYITSIAMTEPSAGSDLASIRTSAIKEGGHYIVNGQKTFITNGINGNLALVAVKTNSETQLKHRGISLLLIEEGTPGFTKGKQLNKVGMHSQDTAELFFEDCRVPVENLLGEEGKGFSYLMEKLQQERLIVAISAQIASEEMFTTMDYVKTRKAFNRPIGSFQHTQYKMAEMTTKVELGKAFLTSLIEDHLAGKSIVSKVSMAKYWLTDTAKEISIDCMQLHGGYGYMEEYKIARRFRDVQVSTIYAGTNEIMKGIIAKGLGF